ncbi:MAG: P-loop NTPase family protein, partial [Caulobacteraceae bacterium]
MRGPNDSSRPGRQLRLKLAGRPSSARKDFIVSPSNAVAVELLDSWPAWPGGRLALVGPEGSGKSHLARAWAERVGAIVVGPAEADLAQLEGHAVLFEDADRRSSDDDLFHLINRTDGGITLLLTARDEPQTWPTDLPDLKSRLKALLVARIEPPDDAVLEAVLRKFFRERQIRPAEEVYPYLLRRIERSVPAAKDVVSRLDELADAQSREITRALARRIL